MVVVGPWRLINGSIWEKDVQHNQSGRIQEYQVSVKLDFRSDEFRHRISQQRSKVSLLQKLVQFLSVKGEDKPVPITSHKGILALGVEGSAAGLGHFTWGNDSSINLIKFWLGPFKMVYKIWRRISCTCRETNQDPSFLQPIAQPLYRLRYPLFKVSIDSGGNYGMTRSLICATIASVSQNIKKNQKKSMHNFFPERIVWNVKQQCTMLITQSTGSETA